MAKKDFTIFDLMERFPDDQSCTVYLSEQKWASGYCCIKRDIEQIIALGLGSDYF